jgi:hypothetical protein
MNELFVVALYLPQFHPIPENDTWWEPGFTEWTNVTKAKPLYAGHRQPDLPSELGFYDLRVPEVRIQQASLAKQGGVSAFCYYHYWFGNGRRILERPLNEVVASGEPDFPFMVCWANQTWTGIWHGLDSRILVQQTYPGREDEAAHFRTLAPMFHDPRYVKVNGKPVFMVYAPSSLPNSNAFTDHWRDLALKDGLPGLYLIAQHADINWDARSAGFDACVLQPALIRRRTQISWAEPWLKIKNKWLDNLGTPTVLDYEKLLPHLLPDNRPPSAIPCVLPNWDNTPRSGSRGVVLEGSSPATFGIALDRALQACARRDAEDNFLFIKSWNEWAEGNHIEPCRRHGRAYLDVLRAKVGAAIC